MNWFILSHSVFILNWTLSILLCLTFRIALNFNSPWWRPWCLNFCALVILTFTFMEFQFKNFVLKAAASGLIWMGEGFGFAAPLMDIIGVYCAILIIFPFHAILMEFMVKVLIVFDAEEPNITVVCSHLTWGHPGALGRESHPPVLVLIGRRQILFSIILITNGILLCVHYAFHCILCIG